MGYKEICPNCGGNNYYVTENNGMKYCFNCRHWEKDKKIVSVMRRGPIAQIRQEYESLTRYWHSNVEHVRKYLNNRGITDESIQRFRLGYCPPGNHPLFNQDNGVYLHFENRVTIPHIYKGTVYDIRARALDNGEPKYTGPHGNRYYRGADYPFNMDDSHYTHIVTEGEFKAIVATQFGYKAVALPGITIAYKTYVPNKYYIVLDAQENMVDVRKAIIRWANYGLEPYVVTLPRSNKKIGLDDYLLEHGKQAFEMLLQLAIPYYEWFDLIGVTYVQ
jgi:hypothetical protein